MNCELGREVVVIEYRVKIGLELHIPIASVETKLFCRCRNPFKYPPSKPNQYVCPICLGLPGTLPSPNKAAVKEAVKLAKALNMEIPDKIQFYRKHYLYPDLPKGYQITQYPAGGDLPIGVDGFIIFQGRRIGVRRIQLEEDPARLVHPGGLGEASKTLVDYNRSGAPLIEMVTEPVFTSPTEARRFIEYMKELLEAIGILVGDVSIKVDANVSLEGGPRIEIKNISSAKDVERALEYEILRLRRAFEEGLELRRETRHWDESRRITIPLRTKELEEEYRYFPDPNLPPIDISLIKEEVEAPETPEAIIERLIEEGVRRSYAEILARDKTLLEIYHRLSGEGEADDVASIVVNEAREALNRGASIDELIEALQPLIKLYTMGLIRRDEIRSKLKGVSGERYREAGEEEIMEAINKVLAEADPTRRRARDYVVGRALKILRERGLDADPREIVKHIDLEVERRSPSVETGEELYRGVYTSPEKPYTDDLSKAVGESIWVSGWVEAKNEVGGKLFIRLRRWTDTLQVVVEKDSGVFNEASTLPRESYIAVKGVVKRDPRAPGGVEIHASTIQLLGEASKPPFTLLDLSRSSLPTRIRYRYLDLRRRRVKSILRIRAEVVALLREYLRSLGFTEINTPTIITSATEGGAELFPLIFYGREAFLAQSPQLYKQMAINAFEKVFEIDSYYRAQKFDTPRHLAEFWSLDVEAAFHSLDDLIDLLKNLISHVHTELPEKCGEDLEILAVEVVDKPSFKAVSYGEAIKTLRGLGLDIRYGDDLSSEAEKTLYLHHGSTYLFITHWPPETRAFYYRVVDNVTQSFDLIGPFKNGSIELASGGERINSSSELIENIRRKGLREESYTWYLEMFRMGMPPHGGFGLGIDRLVASILGLETVLEATFLPRTPKYHTP